MGILCVLGVHRWTGKPTARAGTTVYRCATCGSRLVMHGNRTRRRKRSWVAAALLVSGAILSPFCAGVLLDAGWSPAMLYLACSVPLLLAIFAVLAMRLPNR